MGQIVVLMADDEKDVLDVMAKRVEQEGYRVITAGDGQDAWEKIEKYGPDVVLLDLTMPRMDGFTVLKKLRESSSSEKWQPVIIVSARGELEDMRKGFSMEADHYITKPCRIEDILNGIRLMVSLVPQRITGQEAGDGEA